MPPDYLNPYGDVEKCGDYLPHWQQDEVIQFVTFRLRDALPRTKVLHWKEQRRIWLLNHPKPWDSETERFYHRTFTAKLEYWLDQGCGSCCLTNSMYRHAIADVLMKFQGERVVHEAWVIMPNHVHLLFKPLDNMSKLIQAWKSKSATFIGEGPIWQRNYRDTMIRDIDHFINAARYIRNNPRKANLPDDKFTL